MNFLFKDETVWLLFIPLFDLLVVCPKQNNVTKIKTTKNFRDFIRLQLTVRIAAGGGFESRLPAGNAEKKYDYKIIEKILRTSQAPN